MRGLLGLREVGLDRQLIPECPIESQTIKYVEYAESLFLLINVSDQILNAKLQVNCGDLRLCKLSPRMSTCGIMDNATCFRRRLRIAYSRRGSLAEREGKKNSCHVPQDCARLRARYSGYISDTHLSVSPRPRQATRSIVQIWRGGRCPEQHQYRHRTNVPYHLGSVSLCKTVVPWRREYSLVSPGGRIFLNIPDCS